MPEQTLKSLNQLGASENQPKTLIYNEGWMLRLILQAAQEGYLPDYFPEKIKWFAEGQLRSPFGRKKGTPYEKNTHADGVVGDITTDNETKSAIELDSNAKHFCVYEAKMFSGLSPGTKNAPGYNQAARTIACMAHTLEKAEQFPHELETVGFFVIAPQAQIKKGIFDDAIDPDSIREAVDNRIAQFSDDAHKVLEEWQRKWFEPLLLKMTDQESLTCIAWEALLEVLSKNQSKYYEGINQFYSDCKSHNSTQANTKDSKDIERGKVYKLSDKKVQVCFAGHKKSRVFEIGKREKPSLVDNVDLTPIDDQPVSCSVQVNGVYSFTNEENVPSQVKVLNTGPCNSRVIKVDNSQDETSFLVPNHFLEEPSEGHPA